MGFSGLFSLKKRKSTSGSAFAIHEAPEEGNYEGAQQQQYDNISIDQENSSERHMQESPTESEVGLQSAGTGPSGSAPTTVDLDHSAPREASSASVLFSESEVSSRVMFNVLHEISPERRCFLTFLLFPITKCSKPYKRDDDVPYWYRYR